MSDVKYWLWATGQRKLSPGAIHKYLRHFGSVKKLYFASEADYRLVPEAKEHEVKRLLDKGLGDAEKIEADCRRLGIRILTFYDSEYPDRLRNIYDAPLVLYIKGNMPRVDDEACIAVVGTRKASPYGRQCARSFAAELAGCGGVVVSGLAEGVDSEAIQAAMEAGGTVIGVLGTGPDVVYPAWNRELQTAVAQRGVLISEYPPGTRGSKLTFPQRNRIISGLSVGVVVIEAPHNSGSLITAARAAEQGRDVYVVPGNIDHPGFVGSNMLIRDGAALVVRGWDILSCYRWQFPQKIQLKERRKPAVLELVKRMTEGTSGKNAQAGGKKSVDKEKGKEYIDLKEVGQLSEDELSILRVLSGGALQTDEIIQTTGLDASDALTALTMLELGGYIRAGDGQRFERTK